MSEKISSLRTELLDLLSSIFGEYHCTTNDRIVFAEHDQVEIAEKIGYSESHISRLINPNHVSGQKPGVKAYENIIKDLKIIDLKARYEKVQKKEKEIIEENNRLKEENINITKREKWYKWAIGVLIGLTTFFMVNYFITPSYLSDPTGERLILSENEQEGIWELYCELVQNHIALEALLIKLEPFNNKDDYILQFCEELERDIEKLRKKLGKINLKARNGEYIFDLITKYSINNATENCLEIKQFITNDTISAGGFVKIIKREVKGIQDSNIERIKVSIENAMIEEK